MKKNDNHVADRTAVISLKRLDTNTINHKFVVKRAKTVTTKPSPKKTKSKNKDKAKTKKRRSQKKMNFFSTHSKQNKTKKRC